MPERLKHIEAEYAAQPPRTLTEAEFFDELNRISFVSTEDQDADI